MTTPDASLTVAEALGEPAPAPGPEATPRSPAKAVGRWIARVEYDPDAGLRAADCEVPAAEYQRRFAVLESDTVPTEHVEKYRVHIPGMKPEQAFVPMDVRGVFLDPVAKSRRWKPVRIENKRELQDFHATPSGRRKLLVESEAAGLGAGDVFDTADRGGLDALHLMDTEFIPLMGGPFNKQLYLHDYLYMHARSFELVNHNAIAAAAIKILTRFTLGRGISFHIQHPKARAIWENFWQRNHMRDKIRQMARDLPWQGELMLRYYEHRRGEVDLRVLDPSTCWEIIGDPDDPEKVFYFHFQYPCLRGDVRIACLDGTNPTIAELANRNVSAENPIWVYSYDEERKRIVPGQATRCWRAGEKRCVEVELDNGEVVVASHDHPFLLRNGQYMWAEQLQPGASLMPLYRRTGYEEVWQPDGKWGYTHQMVARDAYGEPKPREVTHHLDENRRNNRPDNLAYLSKLVHDTETGRRRWANPDLAGQRTEWVKNITAAVKASWARGAYAHLAGQPRAGEWCQAIAGGVKRSWQDPAIRARRSKAISEGKRLARLRREAERAAPNNHKVVAVRPAGMHVVYDLTVEKHHNFGLAAGVFTHNTPTQIYTTGPIPSARYIIAQIPPTNIQHVKLNCSSTEKRGRSDFMPAMPWLKRLGDYYNGATVKALLEANLVWKVKIKGELSDLQSFSMDPSITELPPPGGIWLENDQVNLEAVTAQMTATRASSGIGGELVALIAASLNLPLEYFNMSGGAGVARATALVRTDPAVKMIEDRQQILREVIEEIYVRQMALALARGQLSREDAREEPEARADPEQMPNRQTDEEDWLADRHAGGIRARLATVRG
jgi:hypothetical protein